MTLPILAISMWTAPLLTARSVQLGRLMRTLRTKNWISTIVTLDPATFIPDQFLDWDLLEYYGDVAERIEISPGYEHPRIDDPAPLMTRWTHQATRKATELARSRPFAVLATFASPWENHEIGLQVQRATGLPWLAHFSDPWADNPYFSYLSPEQKQLQQQLEARVIERADALVFVSETTRDATMSKYPAPWRHRSTVVPHAFDRPLMQSLPDIPTRNSRFRLLHGGNFYGSRTPKPLLEALSMLRKTPIAKNLDVRMIGLIEPKLRYQIAKRGLEEILTIVGQRPYIETLFDLAISDAAMVIDANFPLSPFLPSKLIDLIGLEKPIIGVTPPGGTTDLLLQRLQCPSVPPDDSSGLAKAITTLHDQWQKETLGVSAAYRRVAEEYNLDEIGQRFALALKQAVTTRQARS